MIPTLAPTTAATKPLVYAPTLTFWTPDNVALTTCTAPSMVAMPKDSAPPSPGIVRAMMAAATTLATKPTTNVSARPTASVTTICTALRTPARPPAPPHTSAPTRLLAPIWTMATLAPRTSASRRLPPLSAPTPSGRPSIQTFAPMAILAPSTGATLITTRPHLMALALLNSTRTDVTTPTLAPSTCAPPILAVVTTLARTR
mmetsp:Transcript_17417/g.24449  ORF Transcript_17417/g.24449 Transcript_17417/m.24449 type:complete len:202 (+) Transcript_17417:198-803(+)